MEINHYLATETFLQEEFKWLEELISIRLQSYFNVAETEQSIYDVKPPIVGDRSTYEQFLIKYRFDFRERVIVAMIAASALKPEVFDLLHTQNATTGMTYTEFGGKITDRRFEPTFRTAAFVLNESQMALPLILYPLFDESHPFSTFSLLDFSQATFQTRIDTVMRFTTEAEHLLYTGEDYLPEYNSEFPAKALVTDLEWEDMVVSKTVKKNLEELLMWFTLEPTLKADDHLKKWIKPGYRALFYGVPGTGKTLTASLLAKKVNRPIYRIDLSMVVSKYIGETEKNLAKVFDRAKNNDWILFFDEADALFGKRTKTSSSNDRHANQEVAYLLQRIEDFPGMIILSTNLQNNMDDAFSRRFQMQIEFKKPDQEQRLKLWKKIFIKDYGLDEAFIDKVAEDYELTGGALINILRTAVAHSHSKDGITIVPETLLYAIRKELEKEGHV
ncbi:ATP-binding protein [Lacinutrix chionoecetis]